MKAFAMRKRTGRIGAAGLAVALGMVLTSCSGRGGGQLGPSPLTGYAGAANIGFTFTCDPTNTDPTRSINLARLHISLEYQDKDTNLFGSSFGIHGEADAFDQYAVNAICSDPFNGALSNSEIQFDGVYTVRSGSGPNRYSADTCRQSTMTFATLGTVAGCRFTVYVKDNGDGKASPGDDVSITLFGGASTTDPTPLYSRAGKLVSGNAQVDNP